MIIKALKSYKRKIKISWLFRPHQAGKNQVRIYINTRPGRTGGPRVFVQKFSSVLIRQGYSVSFDCASSCACALMLILSPGDEFFMRARREKIRTIGRIGGFYHPLYFDKKEYRPPFQDRRLTPEKIGFNSRLKSDLGMYDHVVYQSMFTKTMCDLYLYKREGEYSVIHNGVDTSTFYPAENNNHPLTLIHAGTLRHEYIFNTILPVFLELKKTIPQLRLIIAGPMDGACHLIFKEYADKYKNDFKNVEYLGAVSNDRLPGVYRRADIYLHPRQGDWSPNAIIEALASGLPVVCGKWGGQSEIIGSAGIAVDSKPWDYSQGYINGFIHAVNEITQNLNIYKSQARKLALEDFNLDKMIQRYLRALGVII